MVFYRIQMSGINLHTLARRSGPPARATRELRYARPAVLCAAVEARARKQDKTLYRIDSAYSGSRCSACGDTSRANRKPQVGFRCPEYGCTDPAAAGHFPLESNS